MKRTIEPDDLVHHKCKRMNNDYERPINQTKLLSAFETQLQKLSPVPQVDGTADDSEGNQRDNKGCSDASQKMDTAKQNCGMSVSLAVTNNPVLYNCASSAMAPTGMMNIRSEQNACNSSEAKPVGVMQHQPYNGIRSSNLYSYPNFVTLHQAQQHQQMRPPQQYQVVTGLPLSWNSGEARKILPTDFDSRFRMQQFPRINFQGSSVAGQVTPGQTMLDVRLRHPTTAYTMIQPHSVKVAATIQGPSVVHGSSSNLVPFGSHSNQINDTQNPVASGMHHVQNDTGKAYLLEHGPVLNKSVTHEQGQWLKYPVKKEQGTESLYRTAATYQPFPQQVHVVQSKPELAMPYSVNSFLNAPVRCVVAGLDAPRGNSFWTPVSSATTANKQIPLQDKIELTSPYFHNDMLSCAPQLMPSNISHHQKLHSLPQRNLFRPAVGGSNVNNFVVPVGSMPSSELGSFPPGVNAQMQVSDGKHSNYLHTGMQRKQYQFDAENSLAQQASDGNGTFYRPSQLSVQPAVEVNPHQSSVPAGWNHLHSAGADFKARAYEQLSVRNPSPNIVSTSKVLPATTTLPEPPDKPPTEDPNDEKYVLWHKAHQDWLHNCITGLEGVIAVHKRKKKWLTTKEKNAQKAGRQLSAVDVERLATATEEHSKFQQQLLSKRKELRTHQTQNDGFNDATIKLRNIFSPDETCLEKQVEVVKRDKPLRRPSSLKLKQKCEDSSTLKVDSISNNTDDDPLSSLKLLPQLTLQHPDVTAVPDLLSYQSAAAGETVCTGSYGSMLIKDLPSEYDLPDAVKSDPLPPEIKDLKEEVKTQDVTATLSVTLTLTTSTTDHISRVLDAIADLLKIAVPPVFEIQSKSGVEEAVKVQSLIAMRPKFCRHCSVVVAKSSINSVKYLSAEGDSKETSKEHTVSDWDENDAVFCSVDCRMEFSNAYLRTVKMENCAVASDADSSTLSGTDTQLDLNSSVDKCSSELHVENKHQLEEDIKPAVKRQKKDPVIKWKNKHYKLWSPDLVPNKPVDSTTIINDRIQFDAPLQDTRHCILCRSHGDGVSHGPGRLLMMDVDCWVHLNCALWSYEVFEAQDGTLFNVDKAYRNSMSSECILCHRRGATLTCFEPYCNNVYHLQCAIDDSVAFLADKTIKCCQHSSKLSPTSIMDSLIVERLVYVDRDESRQLARLLRDEDVSWAIRMGSLIVYDIGQLLPHQMQTGNYNSTYYIYPIGFRSVRYYWSFRRLNQRCQYTCRIEDAGRQPLFVVVVTEEGFDDLVVREHSCQELWRKIFDRVAKLRLQHGVVKLHSLLLVGEELFGLSDATVIRVLESMPGIELLPNYYCRNVKSSLFTLPLPVNPTGCVRSEPRLRTLYKRSHPLLNSVQRSGTSIAARTTSAVVDFSIAQYMKQFTHSKLQQFRSLKTEWRNNVYLRRSNVQGLGLFAAREMEKHTMVIEYIGQLIRNEVSEIREKIYDQQNHGIYMFRLNDDFVIDATMAGGPARYINHSCSPNCFTEMVPTEKGDKIVIITKRKINTGEELSYDYKFDLEDEKHKIPCLCGSSNCRKWMN